MTFLNENHIELSDLPLVAGPILAITPKEKFSLIFVKNSSHVLDETN